MKSIALFSKIPITVIKKEMIEMKKYFLSKNREKTLVKLCTAFLLFCTAQVYAEDAALQAIKLAQQDYLQKDGPQLLRHIKESLVIGKNHPLVVKNVLGLYATAQKAGILNDVKVDWQIPAELKYLNVSAHRRYLYDSGRVRFFMSVGANLTEPDILEQLQVIRYPDEVILDKLGHVGEWKNQTWAGQPTFWISENWHNQPVKEGLYLINIKVKNQSMVQGWFIITDENSSASPVIKTPELNQVFNSDQPNFIWKAFHSPEFKAEEKTKVTFKIIREESNLYEEIVNADLTPSPDSKELQFQVGDRASAKSYEGINNLIPGIYQFVLGYREQHHFGDLLVTRVSTTKVPFSVAAKK
jgi:hypothetical protein